MAERSHVQIATGTATIGDKMPDGTVYAGVSPDTGKAMYTTISDSPQTYTFNGALESAARLYTHGHDDWRVPTKDELNMMFNNRAAIGGFDESASYPAGWYWSYSQKGDYAWDQCFRDGYQNCNFSKTIVAALRCVRG